MELKLLQVRFLYFVSACVFMFNLASCILHIHFLAHNVGYNTHNDAVQAEFHFPVYMIDSA